MKEKEIYARLTTFEPDHPDTRWGSVCIEVSTQKTNIPAPRSVLSDLGERRVRNGHVVRFFPDDIGYRELRPLFE